jgi:mRNA interferase MazF
MNEGDIALAPLPQADGQIKNRPVVLLRSLPPFGDFLVCGVSTQLQQRVENFDEVIAPPDKDFASTGLKAASLIRLGFLAVLPDSTFLGKMAHYHLIAASAS